MFSGLHRGSAPFPEGTGSRKNRGPLGKNQRSRYIHVHVLILTTAISVRGRITMTPLGKPRPIHE